MKLFDIELTMISNTDLMTRAKELDLIFEYASVGLFYLDTDLRYTRVNQALCKRLGIPEKDWIGKRNEEILYWKEWAQIFDQESMEVLKSKTPKTFIQPPVKRKDEWVWTLTSKIPNMSEQGELIGLIGIDIDITEEKKNEKKLQFSEKSYKAIFDNAIIGIVICDSDGKIILANHAMSSLCLYSNAELRKKKIQDLFPLFPKIPLDTIEHFETELLKKDGFTYAVELSTKSIVNENGRNILQIIINDISTERKARKALQLVNSKIIEAQEAERKYIASELHDETVQMLLSLAIDLELYLKKSQMSHSLKQQLLTFDQRIKDILESVRSISQSLRPLSFERLGLSKSLREISKDLTKTSGISVHLYIKGEIDLIEPPIDLFVFRIVQEALNNIKRHSGAKVASIYLRSEPSYLKLIIKDDGIGFQVPSELSSFGRQKKLGLLGMIERSHIIGAKTTIYSKLGKGTRICVYLDNL